MHTIVVYNSLYTGYVVSTTNFVDPFREELYWISTVGRLRGVLPCLGVGPRSFFSTILPGCDGVDNDHGLYLYFNDGQGAIACVHLN